MSLTKEDIAKLAQEPSVSVRKEITQKITHDYSLGGYSEREREVAEEIFRLLVADTEIMVRQALAESLKHSMEVPHDIVMSLANDVLPVASPILEYSYVLQEEDIIAIIHACREVPRLLAIAKRDTMSAPVINELVYTGESEVLKAVLNNTNISLPKTTLSYMLEEYYQDHSVMQELVFRGGLPYDFAEKLFTLVSDELKQQLSSRYRLSKQLAEDTSQNAKQTAMMQFIAPWMNQQDIERLVSDMHRNDRLDDSTIIRSLCIGDLRFFEAAMAKRVGVSVSNARILMFDPGGLGFEAFYDASGMLPSCREAVKILFKLALEETHYGRYKIDDFSERMITRLMKEGYHQHIENMDYLIQIIGKDMQGVSAIQ